MTKQQYLRNLFDKITKDSNELKRYIYDDIKTSSMDKVFGGKHIIVEDSKGNRKVIKQQDWNNLPDAKL